MVNTWCSGPKCENNFQTNKANQTKLSFHKFPKDPIIRRSWLTFCNISKEDYTTNLVLCSAHFKPNYFVINFKSELMNIASAKRLSFGAIPTISVAAKDHPTERKQRTEKRARRALVNQLLEEDKPDETEMDLIYIEPDENQTTTSELEKLRDQLDQEKKMVEMMRRKRRLKKISLRPN